jgi:transposase
MLSKEDIFSLNKKELQDTFFQYAAALKLAESEKQTTEKAKKEIEEKYVKLQQDYEELRYKFQLLMLWRFAPKSEKLPKTPEKQFDEADLTEAEKKIVESAEQEIQVAAHTRKRNKNKQGGRKPLPEWLERIDHLHTLPESELRCPVCNKRLKEIGREICELLGVIPLKFYVERHIRIKYACTCSECIKLAPLPKFPIPKSIASASLIAQTVVAKYCDALPLYRQEKIWQRQDIDIPRKTLCNWVLKAGELVEPLVDLMQEEILRGSAINADETPVQVMKEPDKKNTTNSYMFVFAGGKDGKAIVYKYSASRSKETPTNFLKGYKGYLQTDDYDGYNEACEQNLITRLYCWAHVRRKFHDIVKTTKTHGKSFVALQEIKRLYKLEREAREAGMDTEQKRLFRQEKAKPILEEFKTWLEETKKTTPPKCPLGQAIHYTLDNWAGLGVYLNHGYLEIDNNDTERRIKPFVVGRKNWLFMGSPRGAKIGANWYSIIETAKANGIDPYAYIKYILIRLPYCKTKEERIKLLPWNCSMEEITDVLYGKKTE